MKQQTAMQELIDKLQKQKSILKEDFEGGKWNDDRCSEIDNCIIIAESLLQKEKEQRQLDFESGRKRIDHPDWDFVYEDFEDYYNLKYIQP